MCVGNELERKKDVSPNRWLAFIALALLITALIAVPLTRSADRINDGKTDGKSIDQPDSGEESIETIIEINVNVSLPDDQFVQLGRLNRSFMNKYPHIHVTMTNEPDRNAAYSAWVEQSRQGTSADIMLADNAWVRPFAVRGFLKPADSILTGDALTDQLPRLLEPLRWNGYLWGVPKDFDPYLVLWNAEMLTEAGLSAPPRNWNEFEASALKLLKLKPEVKLLNLSPGDLQQLLVWHHTFNTNATAREQMLEIGDDFSEQMNWLQLAQANIGRLKPTDAGALSDAIMHNRLLAAVLPWSDFIRLADSVRNKLEIDREAIVSPWLNGRSFVVSSATDTEEEALLWIQEMAKPDSQQQYYDQTGELPVRASLFGLNGGYQSKRSIWPPSWWVSVMNRINSDLQPPAVDPEWQDNWRALEEQWALNSEGTHPFFAFGGYMAGAGKR